MILGYIYDMEFDNYAEAYQLVEEIRTDKPLLIVGWKIAKELFPNEFSINSFKIKENIYWTCTKRRDRMVNRENLMKFKLACIKHQIDLHEYTFYDLMLYDYNALDFSQYKSVLKSSSIIYIKGHLSIVGLPLKIASALGFDILADIEREGLETYEVKPEFSHLYGYEVMCF
jgi:hypothetical protein